VGYGLAVPARPRLGWTLAVALAAHAIGAAWASHTGVGRALQAPGEPMELEVEIEPPRVEAPAEVADLSSRAPPERATAARSEAGPATTGRGGAAVAEAAQPPAASAEPSGEGTWTFPPGKEGTPRAGAPLSGAAFGAAVQAGVGLTVAEETKKDEARRRLLPGFTPRDMELGLVPGGALVTLTRDRVRRSRAPIVSRALLEFSTDGAGIVASVRVLDASSGRAEWDEVAAQIAADARARPPMTVPSGARGLSVTLEVTSALKTVNGAAPTDKPLAKALGALTDPLGAAMDGQTPPQHVVAARIVDVKAF
jgi:hypothetical protein